MATILRVIEGGGRPRRHRRRSGQGQQWTCSTCERDAGAATSAAIQVMLSPTTNGKALTGRRAWVCAHCFARGVITRIT